MVGDCSEFNWQPVPGTVAQKLIVGPVLFRIYINNIDHTAESSLTVFADNGVERIKCQKENPSHRESFVTWETVTRRTAWGLRKIDVKPYTWGGITPTSSRDKGLTCWEADLLWRSWGSWWVASYTWASSGPWQQWRLTASWPAPAREQPADEGMWLWTLFNPC